jgi:hypothetical protein
LPLAGWGERQGRASTTINKSPSKSVRYENK